MPLVLPLLLAPVCFHPGHLPQQPGRHLLHHQHQHQHQLLLLQGLLLHPPPAPETAAH
jgi:hypothetical protein